MEHLVPWLSASTNSGLASATLSSPLKTSASVLLLTSVKPNAQLFSTPKMTEHWGPPQSIKLFCQLYAKSRIVQSACFACCSHLLLRSQKIRPSIAVWQQKFGRLNLIYYNADTLWHAITSAHTEVFRNTDFSLALPVYVPPPNNRK